MSTELLNEYLFYKKKKKEKEREREKGEKNGGKSNGNELMQRNLDSLIRFLFPLYCVDLRDFFPPILLGNVILLPIFSFCNYSAFGFFVLFKSSAGVSQFQFSLFFPSFLKFPVSLFSPPPPPPCFSFFFLFVCVSYQKLNLLLKSEFRSVFHWSKFGEQRRHVAWPPSSTQLIITG